MKIVIVRPIDMKGRESFHPVTMLEGNMDWLIKTPLPNKERVFLLLMMRSQGFYTDPYKQ